MASRRRIIKTSLDRYEREAVEFRFEAGGPIGLRDLASSFNAIDGIYNTLSNGGERLSVTELRSGSIIAVLAPFLPLMNQAIPYLSAATTLSDFARKMKKAIDGFAEVETAVAPSDDTPAIAAEIAEVIKPLAGRKSAQFGLAHVKYRSETGERIVEIEALYGGPQIDRALINAERFATLTSLPPPVKPASSDDRNFLRGVQMILHQANRGPAKVKGATGDRGVIESVSDKPLPVYFAEGVNKLKDRMVRSTKNPLKYVYDVDAWVHREDGIAKAFTVTEVHKTSPLVEQASTNRESQRRQKGTRGK